MKCISIPLHRMIITFVDACCICLFFFCFQRSTFFEFNAPRRSYLETCLIFNCLSQLIGGPCGQHGPYTFYKAFKYTKDGVKRIITLSEFFFVKLWMDSDLVCIGELQLLWIDKNSEQVLASLRLYFLPENTPEGRMDHGEVSFYLIRLLQTIISCIAF